MPAPEIDVLIRGAGPVGCSLALALRERFRVGLLGAPDSRPAFRPIALSYASRLILQRLGAWDELAATPIESIHVSQQQSFGRVRMTASDCGVPALGYVTEYGALLALLRERCRDLLLAEAAPAARCVVHAEGTPDQAHGKRYAQDALVALLRTQPAAATSAFERFTPEGPLALLPHGGRYALIWSCTPERALTLANAPADEFLRALAIAAGHHVGRPVQVEGRSIQPLALRVRASRIGPREVYIGNAAQTLHPVAGQGLNLGLRDAWVLSRTLEREDPGDPRALQRFAAGRRLDADATIRITDLLAGSFLGANRVARTARGVALTVLDVLPAPRRFFARRMIYGPSALP